MDPVMLKIGVVSSSDFWSHQALSMAPFYTYTWVLVKYQWTKVLALGVEYADAGDNFQKEPKVVIQYTNTADPRKCITILCRTF